MWTTIHQRKITSWAGCPRGNELLYIYLRVWVTNWAFRARANWDDPFSFVKLSSLQHGHRDMKWIEQGAFVYSEAAWGYRACSYWEHVNRKVYTTSVSVMQWDFYISATLCIININERAVLIYISVNQIVENSGLS